MASAVLLLCLFVAAVHSAPAGQHAAAIPPAVYQVAPAPVATLVAPVKSQYHAQDGLGQYSYGYSSPGQHKEEVKGADGTVVGNYGYVGPDGRHRQVNYVADDFGFHAAGADVPAAPVAQVRTSPVAEIHVPAIAPAPVAIAEQAVYAAPAPVAPEPAVYAAPAAVVPAPAVYAVAPTLSVGVSGAQAHASEVRRTQVTTVVKPATYAVPAPAPAVTYHAAPVAVARPAVYTAPAVAAAPSITVSVPSAEAYASEVHQTQVTNVVQPAVYSAPVAAPAVAVAAPAPAVAIAAPAKVAYSVPVHAAAPAVTYAVSGARAHASEVHQTKVTSVVQPAVVAATHVVAAPAYTYAAQPIAYKHIHKLHL